MEDTDWGSIWKHIVVQVQCGEQTSELTTSAPSYKPASWKALRGHIVVPEGKSVIVKVKLPAVADMPADQIKVGIVQGCTLQEETFTAEQGRYVEEQHNDFHQYYGGFGIDYMNIIATGHFLKFAFRYVWLSPDLEEWALTVAMAWHERLGASSTLRNIPFHVFAPYLPLVRKTANKISNWTVTVEKGDKFAVWKSVTQHVPVSETQ
jgi:hypothetical protein